MEPSHRRTFSVIDPGLSTRMTSALDVSSALRPTASLSDASELSPPINLSTANNEVLREELLEYFKTVLEDSLTEKVFTRLAGDSGLRDAITLFLNNYFDPIHAVKAEQVALAAGASDAIENVITAICDPDDCVLIPGPFWDGYTGLLSSRSVKIVVAHPPTYINHDNYLLPSLQAAYDFSADKSRIKAVLLGNPQNPTSKCYDRNSIVECMEFCQERGLHFISDEAFALCSLKNSTNNSAPFVSALSLTEPLSRQGAVKIDPSRVHVIWSASKLFGCGGFRVGGLISQQNPALINAVNALTLGHVNGVAALYISSLLKWSQLPTIIALNSERLTKQFLAFAHLFRQWNITFVHPTNGIVCFVKLAKNARSAREEVDFCNRLVGYGIQVSPGTLFNGVEREYGWVRLRFGCAPKVLDDALDRIGRFLAAEGYSQAKAG